MKRIMIGMAIAMLGGEIACAGALPDNLSYDPSTKTGTIWPKPIKGSGELSYKNHRQDLSRWVSLSYAETRDANRPVTVKALPKGKGDPARGKKLAFNKKKGNCVACHRLPGKTQFGTGGPSLVGYHKLGRDDTWIYQQVFDARVHNPVTIMPPYGTNKYLSEQELLDLVAYLKTI
ncbi:MAG: sulfur oxidation c-type cytochrome SoxX [Gammaproteobacteria bacterium]|nr:MAG: sulfur oxidation c-type cytochrome SoxX [Gammaproteobacteria bacterium]